MKRKNIALMLILLMVMGFGRLLSAQSQSSEETTTSWLVSVTPTEVVEYQPITFKAYAYSTPPTQIYEATCSLTLRNDTDVIWQKKVSGRPVIYSFSINETGHYFLEAYCVDSAGSEYSEEFEIEVSPLNVSVTASAYWYRPLNVTVTTNYPLSDTNVTLTYKGENYTATLTNGQAEFVNLPPITEPERIIIRIFNKASSYTITPTPPTLELLPGSYSIGYNETTNITAVLVDKFGPINVRIPVEFITTNCIIEGENFTTYETYPVIPVVSNVLNFTRCEIEGYAEVWRGMRIYDNTTIYVSPVKFSNLTVNATKVNGHDYRVYASIDFESPINGTLRLYLNNEVVKEESGYKKEFHVSYTVTKPGIYMAYAIFFYHGSPVIHSKVIHFTVERYEYKIIAPFAKLYAGSSVVTNAKWSAYMIDNDTMLVIATFPGDDYYAPAYKVFRTRIIYPTIEFDGKRKLIVKDVAIYGKIRAYCIVHGIKKFIGEINATKHDFNVTLPKWVESCDQVEIIYKHGFYQMVKYSNVKADIRILKTCYAGLPCTVVRGDSDKIKFVRINSLAYRPNTAIKLKAGTYNVVVYLTNGETITAKLTVKPIKVSVTAIKVEGGWKVTINTLLPVDSVKVVFRDGRILKLKAGTYVFSAEPINAEWDYGEVEFKKIVPLKNAGRDS